MRAIFALCTGLAAALFAANAAAADVGRVILATGETSAVRGGRTVPLARGAAVEEKDILQTGAGSFLQVRFSDSSIMALKEQSQLGVEEYRFSGKPDGKERVAFRLLKGAIRTITGAIGQGGYEMRTTVATVGIRGSMYALGVCEGDCLNADGSRAPDGTFGSVEGPSAGSNQLTTTNKAGQSVIGQGQHFHVPNINSLPVLLIEKPSFLSGVLPGKPSVASVQTGTGTGGGAAADSRPNTLPAPISQVVSTTTNTPLVAGPQTVTAGGLPTGVHMMSTMTGGAFVGGPIGGGTGIVRGQLVWTTSADMDLHLILPTGQQVFFFNKNVNFNGGTANAMLDRDNTSGGAPSNPAVENIAVTGNVPPGNYTFFVRNFGGVTTTPLLRVTGDNNATGAAYTGPALSSGQSGPNRVVTRHPNGTATYSP